MATFLWLGRPSEEQDGLDQALEDSGLRVVHVADAAELASRAASEGPVAVLLPPDRAVAALRAEKHLAALDAFLGVTAHDIASPAATLAGVAELIRDRLAGDADTASKVAPLLRLAEQAAGNLQSIIGDFLELRALDSGEVGYQPQPVNLAELVAEALEPLRPRAEERGVRIRTRVAAAAVVHVDRRRMTRVLHNLIHNAVKFSPDGEVVRVRASVGPGGCTLEVEDRGPGLDEADQERLFRRFVRLSTHPSTGEKGSGLGLVICKAHVEAHGGTIAMHANPDGGSTFTVTLPGG